MQVSNIGISYKIRACSPGCAFSRPGGYSPAVEDRVSFPNHHRSCFPSVLNPGCKSPFSSLSPLSDLVFHGVPFRFPSSFLSQVLVS